MSEGYEWGPWVEHDGKGFPAHVIRPKIAKGYRVQWVPSGEGRFNTPLEQANPNGVDTTHPGWKWKRSGWFGRGDWIASDPAYARITRYRFGKPKPKHSAQVEMLSEIAQGKRDPVEDPVA